MLERSQLNLLHELKERLDAFHEARHDSAPPQDVDGDETALSNMQSTVTANEEAQREITTLKAELAAVRSSLASRDEEFKRLQAILEQERLEASRLQESLTSLADAARSEHGRMAVQLEVSTANAARAEAAVLSARVLLEQIVSASPAPPSSLPPLPTPEHSQPPPAAKAPVAKAPVVGAEETVAEKAGEKVEEKAVDKAGRGAAAPPKASSWAARVGSKPAAPPSDTAASAASAPAAAASAASAAPASAVAAAAAAQAAAALPSLPSQAKAVPPSSPLASAGVARGQRGGQGSGVRICGVCIFWETDHTKMAHGYLRLDGTEASARGKGGTRGKDKGKDDSGTVYVPIKSLRKHGSKALAVGERVEFEIADDEKGRPTAHNVTACVGEAGGAAGGGAAVAAGGAVAAGSASGMRAARLSRKQEEARQLAERTEARREEMEMQRALELSRVEAEEAQQRAGKEGGKQAAKENGKQAAKENGKEAAEAEEGGEAVVAVDAAGKQAKRAAKDTANAATVEAEGVVKAAAEAMAAAKAKAAELGQNESAGGSVAKSAGEQEWKRKPRRKPADAAVADEKTAAAVTADTAAAAGTAAAGTAAVGSAAAVGNVWHARAAAREIKTTPQVKTSPEQPKQPAPSPAAIQAPSSAPPSAAPAAAGLAAAAAPQVNTQVVSSTASSVPSLSVDGVAASPESSAPQVTTLYVRLKPGDGKGDGAQPFANSTNLPTSKDWLEAIFAKHAIAVEEIIVHHQSGIGHPPSYAVVTLVEQSGRGREEVARDACKKINHIQVELPDGFCVLDGLEPTGRTHALTCAINFKPGTRQDTLAAAATAPAKSPEATSPPPPGGRGGRAGRSGRGAARGAARGGSGAARGNPPSVA